MKRTLLIILTILISGFFICGLVFYVKPIMDQNKHLKTLLDEATEELSSMKGWRELSHEEMNIVGHYEQIQKLQIEELEFESSNAADDTHHESSVPTIVFSNGIADCWDGEKKETKKWKIVDGLVHVEDSHCVVDVFRIEQNGDLTLIGGKDTRTPPPYKTYKRIKGGGHGDHRQ